MSDLQNWLSKQQDKGKEHLDNFSNISLEGVGGMALAMLTAFIRVFYREDSGKMPKAILETVICGILTLTAWSGISAMGYDSHWVVFAGGIIGSLGSQIMKTAAERFLLKSTK